MTDKQARLHLEIGQSEIRLNCAVSRDYQSYNNEQDWEVFTEELKIEEIDFFLDSTSEKYYETKIKEAAEKLIALIEKIQREKECDFGDELEISIPSQCYGIWESKYLNKFPHQVTINKSLIEHKRKIVKDNELPNELRSIKGHFIIVNEEDKEEQHYSPEGKKACGFGIYVEKIIVQSMLSRFIELIVQADDSGKLKVNKTLSLEREFEGLSNENERKSKTALLNFHDRFIEFSFWECGELKFLKKTSEGLDFLKQMLWRLSLYYHFKQDLTKYDSDFYKEADRMPEFFYKIQNEKFSEELISKISFFDCESLFNEASCELIPENDQTKDHYRINVPCKSGEQSYLTMSNYVLSFFLRKSLSKICAEVTECMENYYFELGKIEYILLSGNLPWQGVETFMSDIFGVQARIGMPSWADEQTLCSAAGIGALRSFIKKDKIRKIEKKTEPFLGSIKNFFWGKRA